MKKTELVKAISGAMVVSQVEVAKKLEDVNTIVEVIAKELEVGDKAKIGDYIVIEKKEVAARECRNPKTGEAISKPAYVTVKVKATAAVKGL